MANKITRMLDYTSPNLITSKFSSLLSRDSCALTAEVYQGQGTWHSWIRISTMSGEDVRNKMSTEDNYLHITYYPPPQFHGVT